MGGCLPQWECMLGYMGGVCSEYMLGCLARTACTGYMGKHNLAASALLMVMNNITTACTAYRFRLGVS